MIKACLLIGLLLLIPVILGLPLYAHAAPEEGTPFWERPIWCCLSGIMLQWSSFQLLAVPMILLKMPFHVLVRTWLVFLLFLSAAAVLLYRKSSASGSRVFGKIFSGDRGASAGSAGKEKQVILPVILYAAAVLLIGYQCSRYAFQMHLDLDDSRFVVNSVTAYEHDTMLLENPATGETFEKPEGELVKDAASPWSIYIAALSSVTGLHPAIMAHTILPVWILLCGYLVLLLASAALFPGDAEKRAWFLLFAAVLIQFYGGNVYTKGVFMLTRIWQGKAVLAAFLMPWLLLLTWVRGYRGAVRAAAEPRIPENCRTVGNAGIPLAVLAASVMSACMLTGVGVLTSAAIVGLYGLWEGVCGRRPLSMLRYWAACLPAVLYGGIYLFVK